MTKTIHPAHSHQSHSPRDPIRLAVLISGGGRSMENLAQRIKTGELNARITAVIASNEKALGLTRLRHWQLPGSVIPRRNYDTSGEFSQDVFRVVREAQAELVCLAGFMSLLKIPDDFAGHVINMHPALLPAFGGQGMYGERVHQAVLDAGCKVSGCTVHLADQTYDTGAILVQRCCEVAEDDTAQTLARRVFAEECEAYPQAIKLIGEGRVHLDGQRARID